MQPKLDVKTLVIGIVLGIIITVAIGAGGGSANEADFGIAIERGGSVLVRTQDSGLYLIDPVRVTAEMVVHQSGRYKGDPFRLSGPIRAR